MTFNKEEYIKIVKYTLESMLDLSKTDPTYNLQSDVMHYYERKIAPDMALTLDEFLNLCKQVGIGKS